MRDTVYDLAVLGPTFFGIAAALAAPQSLIIGRDAAIGSDFVDCLHDGKAQKVEMRTQAGRDFAAALGARGLLSDQGEFYPGPTVFVLSECLKGSNASLMLQTELTGLIREEGLWCLTLLSGQGFAKVYVRQVLDTTPLGLCHPKPAPSPSGKALHAHLYNPAGLPLAGVAYNALSGLYTLKLPLPIDCPWPQARERLAQYVCEQGWPSQGVRISYVAGSFTYDLPVTHLALGPGWYWHPSCAHVNLAQAFDEGAAWAKEGYGV